MHPLICTIGPFSLYSYGLALVLAFFIGASLASREARLKDINPDIVWNVSFVGIVAGIIGARLFYIIENFRDYIASPGEILKLYHGGLSWFGGLLLGAACCIYYLKKKRLPIYTILDLLAPFIALAQSIGRLGCLLNGCCYGRESGWGIYFPVHGKALIPTQIYSSLALLFIFVALRFIQGRPQREGYVFYAYLFLYSIERFIIEFWRADNPRIIFGLSLFQIISVALFIFALIKLILLKRCKKAS